MMNNYKVVLKFKKKKKKKRFTSCYVLYQPSDYFLDNMRISMKQQRVENV